MAKNKRFRNDFGDEAPTSKEFMMVIIVVALLIALAWITYHKFGWFH